MKPISAPFADQVTFTTPQDHGDALVESVRPWLDLAGFYAVRAPVEGWHWWNHPEGGRVSYRPRHKVGVLHYSGQALGVLRAAGTFLETLGAVSSVPWRVTTLHASQDYQTEAAPVLADYLARGSAGEIALTRKRILPEQVEFHGGSHGRIETVYLGTPKAEVRAACYDKAAERLANAGAIIPPTLRLEMRIKTGAATLRDVADPTAIFYHYAAPDLVARPSNVPDWVPMAEGFTLPPRVVPLPAARLKHRVESSPDLGELIELARLCGQHGVDHLLALIRKRAATRDSLANVG